MDKHPTTRKYHRTMAEAFPHDASNAYAIECYRTPLYWVERIFGASVILACAAMFVYAILESLP